MLTVPRIEMNWANVAFGLILLCLAAIVTIAWCFVEQRRVAAFEQRQQRAFDAEMATVELPEWNGDTYEWTPESLAYLADPDAYEDPAPTAEFEPVPASEISGPMPVMDGPLDGGAFMEQLKADNAAFLANLELQ